MLLKKLFPTAAFSPADPGAPQPPPLPTGASQSAPAAAPLDPEEAKRRAEFSRRVAGSFGQIVSVFMRSPQHKFGSLSDLEWQVMPALTAGQFRIAEAVSNDTGFLAPVGVVMWAFVSPDVDQRLSQNLEQPIRLKPEEWKSGNIAWLIEAVGDPRAVMGLLERLKGSEMKDLPVKMRVKGKDGKLTVGRIELGGAQTAEGQAPAS